MLSPQYLPPRQHSLHQGPHAQLAGDGQGLVQQGVGLNPVTLIVALQQQVRVVAAGLGQLGPVARLAAEGERVTYAGSLFGGRRCPVCGQVHLASLRRHLRLVLCSPSVEYGGYDGYGRA